MNFHFDIQSIIEAVVAGLTYLTWLLRSFRGDKHLKVIKSRLKPSPAELIKIEKKAELKAKKLEIKAQIKALKSQKNGGRS